MDTSREVNVQLEVGTVTEVLTVTAGNEAPINTTDASLGNAFENQRVVELPLNARNIVGLLSLQAGVTRQGEVTGGRRDQANITIDGIDANEQQTGLDVVAPAGNGPFNPGVGVALGNALAAVLRMNPDAVQEFRVTTSNPNSSQGRSSGAQVSLVTRSGSNEFHGSLYEFHRNTATSANDWFNNANGRFVATDAAVIAGQSKVGDERNPRPKLIRNVFGGSFGGPILKDRLFFFYSYEGRRDAAEQSVLRNVPTETLRNGIVRYLNTSGGITTLTPADIARIYPATGGVNPVARDIQWATNWQTQSDGVRVRDIASSPSANVDGRPNLFANPLEAYRSFRNARAGEVGDRNLSTIRLPHYFVLDMGLSKNFPLWYAEGHQLQFRWEVFNVTNTQPFGVIAGLSLQPDPFNATAPSANFGRFSGSQTPVGEPRPGRVMQFALRYSF